MQPSSSSSSFQYARHSVQQTGASSSSAGMREREVGGGIGGFTHIENRSVREKADDSWIEVSSQPSDDTYSSASGNEQVARGASRLSHRKKRLRRTEIFPGNSAPSKAYDHHADDLSEVEMISSRSASSMSELSQHEEMGSSSSAAGEEYDSSESEEADEEDTGTMLGIGQRAATSRRPAYGSYPGHSVHEFQRNLQNPSQSFLRHRNPHSGTSSFRSQPATKADHDEALMASLSTLLSCAAAARGLPKVASQHSGSSASPGMGPSRVAPMSSSRVQLDTLQLVPDQVMSEKDENRKLPGTPEAERSRSRRTSITKTPPNEMVRAGAVNNKKRSSPKMSAAVTPRQRSASPRSRSCLTSALSSADASLLTIAFSAGAVILLSAISFSAGYAMGKEVGKTEAEAALGLMGRNAVKEVQRGGTRGLVRGVSRGVVSVSA